MLAWKSCWCCVFFSACNKEEKLHTVSESSSFVCHPRKFNVLPWRWSLFLFKENGESVISVFLLSRISEWTTRQKKPDYIMAARLLLMRRKAFPSLWLCNLFTSFLAILGLTLSPSFHSARNKKITRKVSLRLSYHHQSCCFNNKTNNNTNVHTTTAWFYVYILYCLQKRLLKWMAGVPSFSSK